MVFDDTTAFGAITSLSSAGIQVPRERSVIGFDDIPEAPFYNPPLTTVSQALALQGCLSVEVVVQSVRGVGQKKLDPVYRTVAPKLVARKITTAPARQNSVA
jgi:DNA-binding LacI/PurR family transcriptional regulator